jgi:hypothetical protein
MTKATFLLTLIVTALASMPVHAQDRVFVSGLGSDTNPCTVTQPCRTFQQAFNTAAANGEISVLEPAGYGPVTITHGISIQGHGFGGITAASNGTAITVSVATSDPVSLNGLLLDGAGTGSYGILINSGPSVQILNSVVRHFQSGVAVNPGSMNPVSTNLLIEDTVVSDNINIGIYIQTNSGNGMLNRITVFNNKVGIQPKGATLTIANSVISNNYVGLFTAFAAVWLAKSVISGNTIGYSDENSISSVGSYGDNYVRDPGLPFTLVQMQ